jgi:ribosomal protein S17
MEKLEYYIAYDVENPANIFFYRPIEIDRNTLKIKILDGYVPDRNKLYKLHWSLDGVNFSLIGKVIELKDCNVIFVIKESKIDLRRYPRINTEHLNIKVKTNNIEAKLVDISIRGCKIKIEKGSIAEYTQRSARKILQFIFPEGDTYTLEAYVVNANPALKTVSFTFPRNNNVALKVYSKILDRLKGKNNKRI